MTSAQNISPNRARLWLPLDGQWVTGGIQVGRNLGGAAGAPAYVRMGDGTTLATFPAQRTNTRGVRLDGGDYMRTPLDFTYDEPFTIAVLTDCVMYAAAWLTATYDSATTRGMRFGCVGNGALFAGLYDSGGASISIQSANDILPTSRQLHLYSLTYSGGTVPGSLSFAIDDVVIASAGAGTALGASISSGRDMLIGARWNAAAPAEILPASSIFCVAEYPVVLDAYERRLLKARMMQEIHVP